MKVYVVYESAIVEHEEHTRIMEVFSSVDEAVEAVVEYETLYEDSSQHHEFYYRYYELDNMLAEYLLRASGKTRKMKNGNSNDY